MDTHQSSAPGTFTPPSSTASGAQTPNSQPATKPSSIWSGLMRHFSYAESDDNHNSRQTSPKLQHASTAPLGPLKDGINDVFVPANVKRVASPFRPPPLDPIILHGYRDSTPSTARLLNHSIAEEIRIMLPERLRIMEDWKLVYSLEQDGASLTTLYQKAEDVKGVRGRRIGFVLVVRDDAGSTFGAYLNEYPRPATGYFGNGECFLWRASLLAGLPPPPSADTTNMTMGRTSTISPTRPNRTSLGPADAPAMAPIDLLTDEPPTQTPVATAATPNPTVPTTSPAAATEQKPSPAPSESIRFKAFPYSGVNDYFLNCETGFLSMGAGDGHYGLWLDSSLDKGRSGRSHTFGNEPLSDEGEKFGVLGVELWALGI